MSSIEEHGELSDAARLPAAPKVSVVVVTYNQDECLAQAIESIVTQQTSFPFEIIIAEDCSTDETRAVAKALQKKYPQHVRVVFTPANKGMNRNLRFALSQARAPYIALCDGDDSWLDDGKLERQVQMLEESPGVDMAISRGLLVYDDGRREEKSEWNYGPAPRIVPARELFSRFAWVAPTASLLWRTEVTRDLPRWLDDAPFADMPLMIAGAARGGAAYDPHLSVAYRISHEASFTERLKRLSPEGRADYARRGGETLLRSCADFGMPVRYLAHRIADYRLLRIRELAKAGRWFGALSELGRISPLFLIAGASRRLRRLARAN